MEAGEPEGPGEENRGPTNPVSEPTERQRAVLEAALDLTRDAHGRLTMAAVARAARCSKETLYKWFGDREGLLTAVVRWQAASVRGPVLADERPSRAALEAALERFAADWLEVISGARSIALNRLAIAEAGSGTPDLGAIVSRNGPVAMGARLKPALEAGRAAGHLAFADPDEAFRSFFGLVVRDVQIRALLGDREAAPPAIAADAAHATRQFFALYGADPPADRSERSGAAAPPCDT